MILLIILFGVLFIYTNSSNNKLLLNQFSLKTDELSITSIIFNEDSTISQYINHIFGDKAIYLHKDLLGKYDDFDYELYNKNLNKGRENFKNRLELTEHELTPECSFELLGMTYLNSNNNSYNPFTTDYRHKGPAIGDGSLNIRIDSSAMINCYYRGLYENWILSDTTIKPAYWPTIIYCPVLDNKYCSFVKNYYNDNNNKDHNYTININLQNTTFRTNISIKYNENTNIFNINEFQPKLGICVAIPHISSDNDKVGANSAMLFEWIRYYLKLGLRVFVYDRDGNNYDYVFNSVYRVSRGFDKETIHNLVYNNFTIRGLLDPKSKGLKYDNSDPIYSQSISVAISDNDKQLTLTHCRFDAKAKYNLDDIIVSDLDEFLYCPVAGLTAYNQSSYLHSFLAYVRSGGYDQITFRQRVVSNTTESIRDCIIDAATVNTSKSIFDCFAPYDYWALFHSIKSLHIGLKCPFTGFHSSCPYEKGSILSHDCLCNSIYVRDVCQFVHLTTNHKTYFTEAQERYLNPIVQLIIKSTKSEISKISESPSAISYLIHH